MNNRIELDPPPTPAGIVSVNSRGASSTGIAAKLAFVLVVIGLVVIGCLIGFNKYRAAQKAATDADAANEKSTKTSPPAVTRRRIFDADPTPLRQVAADSKPTSGAELRVDTVCADGSGVDLIGPNGKPLTAPSGRPLKACPQSAVVVPDIVPIPDDQRPSLAIEHRGPAPTGAAAPPRPSRYGGDVLLSQPISVSSGMQTHVNANSVDMQLAKAAMDSDSIVGSNERPPAAGSQQGPVSNLLRPSPALKVSASMIGDRNMILSKGRTIDCNLSMRLINDVSGNATCVLSSKVYSDNGNVVLAEAGSVAYGEYTAQMSQGQRRLFVLWTRLQTPKGVVIDLNSPAADALGTSGLPGYIDNRWSERIGAAVMLSLVEDAIGYQTAKASSADGSGAAQGIAVFQSSTQTGRSLAERILDSTINIKPTLYKNQGDRATIFVSRDLDFGSVYALRAK